MTLQEEADGFIQIQQHSIAHCVLLSFCGRTACSGIHKDQPSISSLLEYACHPNQLTRVHAPDQRFTCSMLAKEEALTFSLACVTPAIFKA